MKHYGLNKLRSLEAESIDIIREVADIKAKRAAASSVDAGSMLDELDALEDDTEEDDES
jgi:hypothetical protein